MATHHKIPPPVFKTGRSYRIYKSELLLWSAATTLPLKQQAATIVLSLPDDGACRLRTIILEKLPLAKLTVDTGLTDVVKILDELLGKDELEECLSDFEEFEDYRRSVEPVNEYIIVFETKYNKVKDKGILLPAEVLAFKLIRGANISPEDKKIVLTGLDYTQKSGLFDQAKTALKKFCGKGGHRHSSDNSADAITVKQEVYAVRQNSFPSNTYGQNRPTGFSGTRRGFWPHSRAQSQNWRGRGQSWRGRSADNAWRGGISSKPAAPRGAASGTRPVNPPGADGKPMLCKGCGSFRHFIGACPYSWEALRRATPSSVNCVEEFESDTQDTYFESADQSYDTSVHADSYPETCDYYEEFREPGDTVTADEPYLTLFTGNEVSHMSNLVAEAQNCAVLDTACGSTVCGKDWFQSYTDQLSERDQVRVEQVGQKGCASFKFGAGPVIFTEGTYQIPVHLAGKDVMLRTDVVDCEVPLLLSKSAMKKAGLVIDMNEDTAVIFDKTVPLNTTSSGHYCIPLVEEFSVCSVTNSIIPTDSAEDIQKKLLKLHRQFGHPTQAKLVTLLQDASVWKDEYKDSLSGVYEKCKTSGLCRFKDKVIKPVVALPLARDFNEKVAIDLKKWGEQWILHIVDMYSRFTVSVFVNRKKPSNIIEALMSEWCSVFGFMGSVLSDNGGEFVNQELQEVESILNIEVLTTAAHSPFQNGLCERNHQIVDSILVKLVEEYPGTDKRVLLKWACMAKNSLQMVEGFSPYQLVIGRNPRLPCLTDAAPSSLENTTQSETFARHLNSLHAARKSFITSESCKRIKTALRHRVRCSEVVFNPGDKVYYKREGRDRWLGPAKVIFQDGKVVFVRHGASWVKVSINRLVKSGLEFARDPNARITGKEVTDTLVIDDDSDEEPHEKEVAENVPQETQQQQVVTESVERPQDVEPQKADDSARRAENPEDRSEEASGGSTVDSDLYLRRSVRKFNKEHGTQIYCVTPDMPSYIFVSNVPRELHKSSEVISAKTDELNKLKMFDVYEEVPDVGQVCIDTRWVVTYKGDGIKARIVARGFQERQCVPSDSPTVAKTAFHCVLAVAALHNWTVKTTDIKSAFLQGKDIGRDIFLKPPKEANAPPGVVWKLKKSLYGLNDGARQFYLSLREELISLGCVVSTVDPSLFIYVNQGELCGVLISHIDDFLHAGGRNFEECIMKPLAKRFIVGRVEQEEFTYVGFEVSQGPTSISISMNSYVEKHLGPCLKLKGGEVSRSLSDSEQTEYRGIVGRLNWVAQGTRPDMFFDVIDLGMKLKQATVRDLNQAKKAFIKLQERDSVVKYPALQGELRLLVFTDAALGNLSDNVSSTSGVLVFLGDESNRVCPLSWRSNKIRRVANSSLAAETLALHEGVKEGVYIQKLLREMMPGVSFPIDAFVDHKGLVESVASTKLVSDRRLRLDIGALKQMLETEVRNIVWIPGEQQLADCLTKRGAHSGPLLGSFQEGRL